MPLSDLKKSPRHRIRVAGIAIAITAAVLSVLVAWRSYAQWVESTAETVSATTGVLGEGITRTLDSVSTALDSMGETVVALDPLAGFRPAKEKAIRILRDSPQIRQILVLDQNGIVVMDSHGGEGGAIDLATLSLTATEGGGGLRFGNPVAGRFLNDGDQAQSGQWVLPVIRRTAGRETSPYKVLAVLNPLYISTMLDSARFSAEGEAALVRFDGQALVAVPVPHMLPLPVVESKVLRRLEKTDHGRIDDIGLFVKRGGFVAFEASEFYPVAVMASVSERDVLRQWLHSNWQLLLALAGPPLLLVGLTHYITRTLTDRMRIAELEAANRAKGDFLAMMSHEVRTPMNGILGMAQLALDDVTQPALRERLNIIISSGEALMSILNDILDFSNMERNSQTVASVEFDLRRLVGEVVMLMRVTALKKGLEAELSIDRDVPRMVAGDMVRLRKVLLNLIGNGIKFTEQGHITVTVSCCDGGGDGQLWLRFDVGDTGIGIAPDVLAQIFDPFTQSDSSLTRRYGGTGLGLTICKQLVQVMGGRISAASHAGQGSTFTVEAPFQRMAVPEPVAVPVSAPSGTKERLNVLVAEDTQINRMVIQAMLEKHGHLVTLVEDGEQAVKACALVQFDLVLMDIQMPKMGGIEAAQTIRQAEARQGPSRVPIFALTAAVVSSEYGQCHEAGMNGVLEKPLREAKLLELVAQVA